MKIYRFITASLLIGMSPVLAETTPAKPVDGKIEAIGSVNSADGKRSDVAVGVPIELDHKADKPAGTVSNASTTTPDKPEKNEVAPISFKAEDIEKIVIKVIQDKPEILVNALQKYGERQQEEQNKSMQESLVKFKDKILDTSNASVLGAPTSAVKVVVFVDPNCPHCRHFELAMHKVREKFPKVTFLVRHWAILGEDSKEASSALIASEKQGKYEAVSKALAAFEGPANMNEVSKLAKAQGVDITRLTTDSKSEPIKKILQDTDELAKNIQLRGTPTVIISDKNGIRIANLTNEDSLGKLIEEAASTLDDTKNGSSEAAAPAVAKS